MSQDTYTYACWLNPYPVPDPGQGKENEFTKMFPRKLLSSMDSQTKINKKHSACFYPVGIYEWQNWREAETEVDRDRDKRKSDRDRDRETVPGTNTFWVRRVGWGHMLWKVFKISELDLWFSFLKMQWFIRHLNFNKVYSYMISFNCFKYSLTVFQFTIPKSNQL